MVDYVLTRLPFRTEIIQTDSGSEFQEQFYWHILDKGINHVYIKPRTPRLNGKVERSHRIDEVKPALNGLERRLGYVCKRCMVDHQAPM